MTQITDDRRWDGGDASRIQVLTDAYDTDQVALEYLRDEAERLRRENDALRAMLDARGVTPAAIAGAIAAEALDA
jgi:hypothetical protein